MSKCVNCGNEILTGDIYWEMSLCNNCHNELYKKNSYVGLLNKEMDGLLDDYAKRRIADLEAKLAEKQKEIEEITKVVAYRDDMDRSTTINGVKFTNEQIITLQNIDYFVDKHNQDKISFAVEQLSEIREYVKECWSLDEIEGKVRLDIVKHIRMKIEQLKEMK